MRLSAITQVVALATLASSQAVRFMPLGDSITEITCWRAYVWDQLSNAGLAGKVDFVGSMTNNPQNCRASTANFDTGHEGHSGWLSIDIANNYLQGWLQTSKPDVIQFMLGTNDVAQGRTTDAIVQSYTKIVQLARQSNPKMKIIIDKLIPLSFNNGGIDALNARISAWATGITTAQSPVIVADCSTQAGYTLAMLRDGIHPNDQGDRFIAKAVGPLITQAIEEVIASRA